MTGERVDDGSAARPRRLLALRLAIALVQAAALYGLAGAADAPHAWPATQPALFAPLVLIAAFVPLLAQAGLGQIGDRPLLAWTGLAALVTAGLGWHDAVRGRAPDYKGEELLWPSPPVWLALAAGLFVTQTLVVASVSERRRVPSYPRLFDLATRLAVQAALAGIFVGLLWAVLGLGAALFRLLDVTFPERLIQHRWFAIPATTLALAVAVHAIDFQPALVRGVRALALGLMSWLLPLLALILAGFLCSLPFLSLEPLWRTHFAASVLLGAAGLLVALINGCYQDGAAGLTRSRVKRLAASAGALELVPLVALAAWALALRVEQHGWTVERIRAAATTLVAGGLALGYAAAANGRTGWLKRLEPTNLAAAWLGLALILALFSPLADPARLMVADQLGRLRSGRTAPEAFDFTALKLDGARWGARALEQLAATPDGPAAALIRSRASQALARTGRYEFAAAGTGYSAAELAGRITMLPAGTALPDGFLESAGQSAAGQTPPHCFGPTAEPCKARLVALPGGAPEAILLLDTGAAWLFQQDAAGHWRRTARLDAQMYCDSLRRQLEQGDLQLRPHELPDLVAGGQQMTFSALPGDCPTGK